MAGLVDMLGLGILLRWRDEATAEMKKAERTLGGLSEAADEAEKRTASLQASYAKLGKAGAAITGFGLAGAGALYGLARAASTFEDALIDTMTMTGLTGDAFKDMERDLGRLSTSMSSRFAMSAADVNRAFYQVLSSGAAAGTKDFEVLADTALMMSRVVGMQPAAAVESLSDALNSFEMSMADAERMADVFFRSSMLGATTVPQFTDAMTESAKIAVETRQSLEDTAAVLVGFANKGIKGARAGTAFRMVMTRLAAPTGDAADALARLGVAVYDADTQAMRPMIPILRDIQTGLAEVTHQEREAALKAIAGEQAFAKLGGLLSSDLSTLEEWSAELSKTGVIQTAFNQKAETLSFAMAGARESLRNVAIELGRNLLPILRPVGQAISWVADSARNLLEAHPAAAKFAVGLAAAATAAALVVGPVLTVVGLVGALGGIPAIIGFVTAGFTSLGAAAGALGAVLATAFWPVTLVAAAVGGLYLAFRYNLFGIRTIVTQVGEVVWRYLVGAWEGVKAALTPLVATFRETWAVLKTALAPIWNVATGIGELLGLSVEGSDGLDSFKAAAAAVGKVVGYALVTPLRIALTAVAYLVQGFAWLLKGATALGSWLGGKLAPYIGGIGKALLYLSGPIGIVIANFGRIRAAVGSVINWVSSNWDSIRDIVLTPVDAIRAGWDALAGGLSSAFAAVGETVTGIFGSIRETILGAIELVWDKVTWVISKIPSALLPESLAQIKADRLAGATSPMAAAASVPAVERVTPRAAVHHDYPAMPQLAFAGAAAGSVDRSIHIEPGAITINATRIDEHAAMQIDRELAKLIERRLERQ